MPPSLALSRSLELCRLCLEPSRERSPDLSRRLSLWRSPERSLSLERSLRTGRSLSLDLSRIRSRDGSRCGRYGLGDTSRSRPTEPALIDGSFDLASRVPRSGAMGGKSFGCFGGDLRCSSRGVFSGGPFLSQRPRPFLCSAGAAGLACSWLSLRVRARRAL